MVYPEGLEVTASDGSVSRLRRLSYYNEQIVLKSYNIYVNSISGKLASVKLSKELIKSYKDEIDIILLNKNKVQVSCKSSVIANKIVRDTRILKDLNFYIPQQKVEVKGRICMPREISEQAAFEGMIVKNRINSNAPLPSIVEVYRIPYFDRDQEAGVVTRTDSDYMLVSFCGSHIPTHVLFENALLIPVQPYFEPVLQCKNCWYFSHSKRACRGKEKCVSCGLTHTGECTGNVCCVNCKGGHRSNDKNCPEFLKRKELSKAKASKTVPSMEVQPVSVPASFNGLNHVSFPVLPSTSKSVVADLEIQQIGKKRRADEVITSSDRIAKKDTVIVSSKSMCEDFTHKLVKDLSLEKDFFNSVIEEVKTNSEINGKGLEILISDKIRKILNVVREDASIPMDHTVGGSVASQRS